MKNTIELEQYLRSEGFEKFNEYRVGVPYFTWTVDLEVEYDRVLRLTEETALRLVASKITNRSEIEQLLGLEDDLVAKNIIAGLIERSAIQYNGEELAITEIGSSMVKKVTVRTTEKFEVENIRYDPYNETFEFASVKKGSYINLKDAKKKGLSLLPESGKLEPQQLSLKFEAIQNILGQKGCPTLRGESKNTIRSPELVRLTPISDALFYREATLQIWTRMQGEVPEIRWRLLMEGTDETRISERLMDLEAQGEQILPAEQHKPLHVSEAGKEIDAAIEVIRTTGETEVLAADQHRDALKEAVGEAQKRLIIISPWLRASAIDDGMKTWFLNALQNKPNLEIVIGYGINKDETDQRKREAQERGLESLKQVRQKYQSRFKLVEIGDTHQKVVVCDDKYVIITSFNFLSNKPSKYSSLIQELGTKIRGKKVVNDVVAKLDKALF